MRRKLPPIGYIDRSIPPGDRDEPQAPTAEDREPVGVTPGELHQPPEMEHCSHCGDWHSAEPPCASRLWDEAMDRAVTLLA
ncbi:MAG TPA: hypothetical protein VNN21_01275 [Dehalococcoidia bacterium]|nr:hypothetical protein [Dehalococcoidia bacterium]